MSPFPAVCSGFWSAFTLSPPRQVLLPSFSLSSLPLKKRLRPQPPAPRLHHLISTLHADDELTMGPSFGSPGFQPPCFKVLTEAPVTKTKFKASYHLTGPSWPLCLGVGWADTNIFLFGLLDTPGSSPSSQVVSGVFASSSSRTLNTSVD